MLGRKHGAISIEMRGSVERMLQIDRASGAYQSRRIGSVEGAHRLAQNSHWRKPKSQKAGSKSSGWYFQRRTHAPVQKSIKGIPFSTSKIMQSDSRQLADFRQTFGRFLRTACLLVGLFLPYWCSKGARVRFVRFSWARWSAGFNFSMHT